MVPQRKRLFGYANSLLENAVDRAVDVESHLPIRQIRHLSIVADRLLDSKTHQAYQNSFEIVNHLIQPFLIVTLNKS